MQKPIRLRRKAMRAAPSIAKVMVPWLSPVIVPRQPKSISPWRWSAWKVMVKLRSDCSMLRSEIAMGMVSQFWSRTAT
ncbi:MAG: hypothetical protein U0841_20490 [Chloroflexia bacterium]